MQASASVSCDDERRVPSAQATGFGIRLLNKYDLVRHCETCKATWFPQLAGGRRLPPTRFLAMSEQVQLVTGEPLRDGSGDSGGGIVANIEKHLKHPMDQIDQADFSEVPTCGRSSRLIGHYIKNRQDGARNHVLPVEERPQAILFRFDHTPATAPNLERIRERVRALNRRLADSGTPFRLRVV